MNNSKDTRKDYESPVTKKVQVEMEGYLCGSANILNPDDTEQGQIKEHQTNMDFTIDSETKDWEASGEWQGNN